MTPAIYSLRVFELSRALASRLPRSWAQNIAPALGRLAVHFNRRGYTALRSNLEPFATLTGCDLDSLCRTNFCQFCKMMADYFLCAAQPAAADSLLEEWRGLENIQRAMERGKGVILVTGHLGNWELGATLLSMRGFPLSVISLEEPSSQLTRWRIEYRRKLGIKTIIVGPGHDFALMEMVHTLRRNEILAMLVDRPAPGTGLPTRLFGRNCDFSSGPALLWQHTGAAVVPAFVLQNPTGRYVGFANTPLDFQSGPDARKAIQSNTQILASHFESIITQSPEQWFNYVPIWNPDSPSLHPLRAPSAAQSAV